ncbi:MAG: hypothetical protein U1G07_10485 [Verrucomicrobiota bacterium]
MRTCLLVLSVLLLMSWPCAAQTEAAGKTGPSLADRVSDLEAYVINGARQTNGPTALAESAGPGHNAWQMTAAALVLFMTLPGLALFYGGLVRRKNMLSVLAQCLGAAGMVTILWWLCGYSIAFHAGRPFWGSLEWAFLRGSRLQTESRLQRLGVAERVLDVSADVQGSLRRLIIGAIAERMRFCSHPGVYRRLDVCRLFSPGPHGLGN